MKQQQHQHQHFRHTITQSTSLSCNIHTRCLDKHIERCIRVSYAFLLLFVLLFGGAFLLSHLIVRMLIRMECMHNNSEIQLNIVCTYARHRHDPEHDTHTRRCGTQFNILPELCYLNINELAFSLISQCTQFDVTAILHAIPLNVGALPQNIGCDRHV